MSRLPVIAPQYLLAFWVGGVCYTVLITTPITCTEPLAHAPASPIFLVLTINLFGFNIPVPSNVAGFFHGRVGYRLEHLPATIRRANRNNMVPGQSARGLGYAMDEPAEQRGRHHKNRDDNQCVAAFPILFY